MLGGVRLKVSYTHEKTCFAYINSKYSTSSQQSQCIQVLYKVKQLFLWTVFSSNIAEGHIACNPIFSKLIGLDENCEVFVSPYSDVKVLDELYIDTDSPDDQEILEHNAELLQLRILDQLRYVVANQKAVVWISVSLPIVFTPKQTGLLVNHSKIVVAVDIFNSLHKTPLKRNAPKQIEDEPKFNNVGLINDGMLRQYLSPPKKVVLRALTIDGDGKRNLTHPYTVFIHEDLVDTKYKSYTTVLLATIQDIPLIIKDNSVAEESDNNNAILNDICVEIIPIDNAVYRSMTHEVYNKNIPTVLIPKSLNSIINIQNGMKVMLTFVENDVEQPEHIDIITYSESQESDMDIIEKFKICVIDNTHSGKMFLINNNIVKQNTLICNGLLQFKLKPDNLKYTLLNSESFRHCTISAKCLKETELNEPKPIVNALDYDSKLFCRTMKSMEKLIENVISNLYFEVHREANFRSVSQIKSNVIVTGPSGTGKSTLCQIVQRELPVWSHIQHCRALKGRKDIPEVLGSAVLMCQEHSPSVLICDDVDALVPPNMEGGSPQDIAYYQRLAIVIKHILQSCVGVAVLMTSTSMNSLHPVLKEFSGKPLFTAQFDIKELEREERTELLKHLLNERIRSEFTVEDDDVTKMAMDTTGQNVRDVSDYLNKRIFDAVKRKKVNPAEPKPRLLEDTLKDKEDRTTDVWAPLGGLKDVKQRLTECIFWPMMYPALFPSQNCGILLYGPPGTGKSYIGSCLAAAANMNFILVKGPELLSKYIGQSEKAVRDIFDKADMKKPCILFFDEFDSLAPKRGHDSTGVTDRVVNQLLAQLDGAEGGTAFPVMAATSRPDLIDPALLRAQRIDTHVYCGPPDLEDRLEILQILSKDVTLSAEVDLESIASRTAGCSPADLRALLVTAQLYTLEDKLESNPEDATIESVVVSVSDVERALQETKPSLSSEQMAYYDMIYKRFRGETLSTEERALAYDFQKQRVTLA